MQTPGKHSRWTTFLVATVVLGGWTLAAEEASVRTAAGIAEVRLTVEPGHPWTPPFGLERVGRPLEAVIEIPAGAKPAKEYVIVAYRDGKEMRRQQVKLAGPSSPGPASRFGRVTLQDGPSEVALLVTAEAQPVEIARAPVKPPAFEADAVARPDTVIHPVDLGTIFVPADWLLLAGGQKAEVELAALSRDTTISGAGAIAWYESAPDQRIRSDLALSLGIKKQAKLAMHPASKTRKQDLLHVAIVDGAGREIWHKSIRVLLVPEAPRWPSFGATATKLRYDAPIPVAGGQPINYETGWDDKLQDIVVCFPNGARFVFWRGSSYCPFWASRSNTGICYEWAELFGKHMTGVRDCVEPLQDKELRYGRVTIVESTSAHIHLRWEYQSCDLDYRVWGDFATEDYHFYPDGLGTRVLTLTARPLQFLETNELIFFTPQSGYPFDYLPANLIDILWPQGKAEIRFPYSPAEQQEQENKLKSIGKDTALLHRIRFGKDDPLAAIQYSPWGCWHALPGFAPFYHRGAMVTPMYWGCHWPLSRGYPTAYSINDRIHETPGHNSSIHAGPSHPIRSESGPMRDAQGKSNTMTRQTWVWLIGMTAADDSALRQWMVSFAHPPALELSGARQEGEAHVPERRALRLVVDKPVVTIKITAAGHCVNPVFELRGAPKALLSVKLNDQALAPRQYAWDGATLWLDASFSQPTTLRLEFDGKP
jgi:hypothetical protein